jgi:phage gpG-like protein
MVDSRVDDIEIIYNELVQNNKIDTRTKDLIEKFLNNFYDEDKKYYDMDNREYPSFKHYKINEIKILLFNNQDKITNDIALLLTATDKSPIQDKLAEEISI